MIDIDRVFIDTNILVYSFLRQDHDKHNLALKLLSNCRNKVVVISTQVVSEVYSALTKNKICHESICQYIFELEEELNIVPVSFDVVQKCLILKIRYGYSYWDSLILSAALIWNCSLLYSEDMQHNQVIEGKLTIVNPFQI